MLHGASNTACFKLRHINDANSDTETCWLRQRRACCSGRSIQYTYLVLYRMPAEAMTRGPESMGAAVAGYDPERGTTARQWRNRPPGVACFRRPGAGRETVGRWKRVLSLIALDILGINLAYFGSLYLRFDGHVPPAYLDTMVHLAPWLTLICLGCYWLAGLYRSLWEYASVRELYAVIRGATLGATLVVLVAYAIYAAVPLRPLPRSVYVMAWIGSVVLVGGTRLGWRVAREWRVALANGGEVIVDEREGEPHVAALPMARLLNGGLRAAARMSLVLVSGGRPEKRNGRRRVLVAGAGDAGAMVVRELHNHPELGLEPVGFVDDDAKKSGLRLHGLPVLGGCDDIPRLVREKGIERVIIAMPSAPGAVRRKIAHLCSRAGVKAFTVPGVYELVDGRVSVRQIREVRLEDLLGREPVRVNLEEIAGYLEGKTVLVTGAGGSIGSELCRQAARFSPRRLVLVECSENNLFEIEHELTTGWSALEIAPELADVRDRPTMERIFGAYRPEVVFHAAAYKHVPLSERWPERAFANNVVGTYNVALLADRYGSGVFILISTDKAVNPVSVMGATKRAAELIVQDFARRSRTRFAAVRFGNVLGSSGSVVNIFRRQIARGGPVTVTHPDMERYFMTTPEAVQLVIQAGAYARGGEIFVLDMGERVRVLDLAREMIRLSGFEPDRDVAIRFTGVRPGEKLREELFRPGERPLPTGHARIFSVANHCDSEGQGGLLRIRELLEAPQRLTAEEALNLLREMVGEWRPSEALGARAGAS